MKDNEPEYLTMNPSFKWLKKDINSRNEYHMYLSFGEIRDIVIKVPMRIYPKLKNKDLTDIKNYNVNEYVH
tara:strand:+ start:17393 stop:17605 length:213 start_codon:yes stop_codon:yes gene_type:complete